MQKTEKVWKRRSSIVTKDDTFMFGFCTGLTAVLVAVGIKDNLILEVLACVDILGLAVLFEGWLYRKYDAYRTNKNCAEKET
jgi:hypothetical protein